jgi:hypothetical protein
MPASACRKNPMICSSLNLLFFMPVILHGDGLHKHDVGTAGRGQVIGYNLHPKFNVIERNS